MAQAQARYLVAAGSTRESIDRVRHWGNPFTGKTGLEIARELSQLGPVDLLTSNLDHLREIRSQASVRGRISGASFATHAELKALLEERMRSRAYRGVFMTAAVADYRPAGVFEVVSREIGDGQERWVVRDVQAQKVRSSYGEIAVLGQRTEKLVDLFRTKWSFKGLLVKFKLEAGIERESLVEIGRTSRRASGADYLVANTLEMVSGPGAGAFVIGPDDQAEFVTRERLAARLCEIAGEFGAG